MPRGVADWTWRRIGKLMVEQWLESPQPQQHFVAPNLLLEHAPARRALILQVIPVAPGAAASARFDFAARRTRGKRRAGAARGSGA